MATRNVPITMDFTKEEFKKIKEACKFINDGDPVTLDILMKIEVHFAWLSTFNNYK